MIGQFPDGIALHCKNLRWALTEKDHSFIITLPEYIERFGLKNDNYFTYIAFETDGKDRFINFWGKFPEMVNQMGILPEWFLLMEQDIWFHKPLGEFGATKEILNYLPLQEEYHAVMSEGKLLHPRVWEGANLIHGSVIRSAIDRGINFSFTRNFFCELGSVKLNQYKMPDTFDEVSLFCALEAKTRAEYEDRAVHLRGPESFHRQFPDLYEQCEEEDLLAAQKKVSYLCIYGIVAAYYIAGNWTKPLVWSKMRDNFREEYRKLVPSAAEWMLPAEYERLCEVAGK